MKRDQIEEEEEQHVEGGTEVVDSSKGSETSKTNDEDRMEEVEEVNEDAPNMCNKLKKKKMQVRKNKPGRRKKDVDASEESKQVGKNKRGRGNKVRNV
ncbi:hypothetical protein Bca101_025381 [Brassica carinata]